MSQNSTIIVLKRLTHTYTHIFYLKIKFSPGWGRELLSSSLWHLCYESLHGKRKNWSPDINFRTDEDPPLPRPFHFPELRITQLGLKFTARLPETATVMWTTAVRARGYDHSSCHLVYWGSGSQRFKEKQRLSTGISGDTKVGRASGHQERILVPKPFPKLF